MSKKFVLSLMMMGVLAYSHSVFGQIASTGQQRILQPIIINGQQSEGVLVVQNGTVQNSTCPSPQPYATANQSESGWACFEQTTGMWLLHALPPPQATAPQQKPTIVYQQSPVYVPAQTVPVYSYPYGYSYGGYYPYYSYYPYIVGPRFGVGFGFGFRSPIIINRPFISRPFGGFRQAGIGFGRLGRR